MTIYSVEFYVYNMAKPKGQRVLFHGFELIHVKDDTSAESIDRNNACRKAKTRALELTKALNGYSGFYYVRDHWNQNTRDNFVSRSDIIGPEYL